MIALQVVNISKAYKNYNKKFDRLKEWILPSIKKHTLSWILQDINLTLYSGESLGIIGMNGAGKSTLLKLITGTAQATAGSIQIHGRVAAMLELGLGFHPDFTGRQNVYLTGQLLGLSIEEIRKCMPEIEQFAEIGSYIDEPIRIYSSGMQVRLAFSVATAVRPDVLIIDEALSVGDTYFQHKSFERIREFRRLGTTLLIVSHDKSAIQTLCDKAILLNNGKIEMSGNPEVVMDYYNALLADKKATGIEQMETVDGEIQTVSGSGEARIKKASILDATGEKLEIVAVGQAVSLMVEIETTTKIEDIVVGYMIKDKLGQPIFGTNTYHHKFIIDTLNQGDDFQIYFDFLANLGPGSYSITVALHQDDTHIGCNYEWKDKVLIFNVINTNKKDFIGCAWMPPKIRIVNEN